MLAGRRAHSRGPIFGQLEGLAEVAKETLFATDLSQEP